MINNQLLIPFRQRGVVYKMNKSTIKEANEHLQQLHQRVYELESQVQVQGMHTAELQRANTELQRRLQEQQSQTAQALGTKDQELAELGARLQESERQVHVLLESARERDAAVLKLEAKARLFYEVVEHRAVLKKIVATLEELDEKKDEEDLDVQDDHETPDVSASEESYLPEQTNT